MGRLIAGGILGGIVVFFWGAFAHMVLPLGMMGLKSLPHEDAVIKAIGSEVPADGLYFFPGMDLSHAPTESELAAREAKFKNGPSGLLLVKLKDAEAMSPRQLVTEVATDILAALIAGALLTCVRLPYAACVGFVTALGVFGFVSIAAPWWNWYGYPSAFMIAEAIDQVVGWTLAGLVLAALIRPGSPSVAVEA